MFGAPNLMPMQRPFAMAGFSQKPMPMSPPAAPGALPGAAPMQNTAQAATSLSYTPEYAASMYQNPAALSMHQQTDFKNKLLSPGSPFANPFENYGPFGGAGSIFRGSYNDPYVNNTGWDPSQQRGPQGGYNPPPAGTPPVQQHRTPAEAAAHGLMLRALQQSQWGGLTGGAATANSNLAYTSALQDYAQTLAQIRQQREAQLWDSIGAIGGLGARALSFL